MTFRRPAVGLVSFVFCLALTCHMLSGAPATELPKVQSPKEIADQWRFANGQAKDSHFWHQDAAWTYVETGAWKDGAPLEKIWNFYAAKCGADQRFDAKAMSIQKGRSSVGDYVLLDGIVAASRTTTFHLRNDAYSVTVLIWPDTQQEGRIFCSLTVTMR